MACLRTMEDFRSCRNSEGCGNGWLAENGEANPIMKCPKCGFRSCFIHDSPWHEGTTCQEYTLQLLHAMENADEATRLWLKAHTQKCPNCNLPIEQAEGTCDAMIHCGLGTDECKKNPRCKHPNGCGIKFCFQCLGSTTDRSSSEYHRPTCRYA